MRRPFRVRRRPRAFTMVELLVTLGIFAIVIGSILSVFMAGIRTGVRSQQKREAGRVALAVFDLVDRGFLQAEDGARLGRDENGNFPATDVEILSQDLMNARELDNVTEFYAWSPTYVVRSPVSLVWRCRITDSGADVGGLHLIAVTVALNDTDERPMEFDAGDREVGRYCAVLADRGTP